MAHTPQTLTVFAEILIFLNRCISFCSIPWDSFQWPDKYCLRDNFLALKWEVFWYRCTQASKSSGAQPWVNNRVSFLSQDQECAELLGSIHNRGVQRPWPFDSWWVLRGPASTTLPKPSWSAFTLAVLSCRILWHGLLWLISSILRSYTKP